MRRRCIAPPLGLAIALVFLLQLPARGAVDLRVLPGARDCVALVEVSGELYGGLADGGIVVLATGDLAPVRRWTTGDGLSGQRIADLAWTGANLWVATRDGGLTRVTLAADGPVFRQVTNIADLAVTAVTGTVRGETERVWYGTDGAGFGLVSNGLPGGTYTTTEDPGLVSDVITALALRGDDLVIGTDAGVSLLRDNLLTDWSGSLAGTNVGDLLAVADTVWAAADTGVYRRAPDDADWVPVGALGRAAAALAVQDDTLWCLAAAGAADLLLWRWDGAAWQPVTLPRDGAHALVSGSRLWVGGTTPVTDDNMHAARAWVAGRSGDQWSQYLTDDPFFVNSDGAAVGSDGTLWLGGRQAEGIAWGDGDTWQQVTRLASADNDSAGLFDDDGPILSVAAGPDGDVWFCQFQSGGVIHFDPRSDRFVHLDRTNSGLPDDRIVALQVHPAGPVLMCSDVSGVHVLVDPDRGHDPGAWLHLPTDAAGLGGGTVRDAVVVRPDRIAFAVENVGVAFWDPNGLAGGAEDDLTWLETGDDQWARLDAAPAGSFYSFAGTRALAVADDGTVWAAGGSGLAHFRVLSFGAGSVGIEMLGEYHAKRDPAMPGLMQEGVSDVCVDGTGSAWICHDLGIERVDEGSETTTIVPYTSVGDYFRAGLGVLYSPTIIAGLPPGKFRETAVSPDGSRILVSGENGAVLVTVTAAMEEGSALASVRLYPNPFRPGRHAGLRVGGVVAPVQWGSLAITGGVAVVIYDLEGQVVYRNDHVANDEPFWDGRNLAGDPAAPGVYLVRIAREGAVVVRQVSLVR